MEEKMNIQKDIVASLSFPYSICIFEGDTRRVFTASEKKGACVHFPLDGGEAETVWDGDLGGTTGIAQIPGREREFLAIEGFYKGLQCETAGIMHVWEKDGAWRTERVFDLPFAHRICTVERDGVVFVIVCSLCAGKDNFEDWSKPGTVYLGRWTGQGPLVMEPIVEGIHQNHGMFKGTLDGREVILVSGRDGVFEIAIPERADGAWPCRKLIDEPVGDVCACDIDEDGEDEIVAIKGFHGNEMAVYKRVDGTWSTVYSHPISFGHFVWSGNIFGHNAIITGYRRSNGALVLLRKVPGEWRFDIDYLDQLISPINIEVVPGVRPVVYATSESTHQVLRYTLEE
jgi:hypothetical protein